MNEICVAKDIPLKLAELVLDFKKEALRKHKKFTLAVSGGSLPAQLERLTREETMDWGDTVIFFADERCVPLDHPDSNYKALKENFLEKLSSQPVVHAINETLIDKPDEAAEAYMKALLGTFASRNTVKFPVFDAILLGMGPDGHTCSLFPGHDLLSEDIEWVRSLEDSPKPPSNRISLTLPVLNHAHNVVFVCAGSSKAETLHRVLNLKDTSLPAALVRPDHGKIYWVLDEQAASKLNYGSEKGKNKDKL